MPTYTPEQDFTGYSNVVVNDPVSISYTPPGAPIGYIREVPIVVTAPDIPPPPGPLPVVIWSHGGADGAKAGVYKKNDWRIAFAKAGYVTINLTHKSVGTVGRNAIEAYLNDGVTTGTFKAQNYLRLFDIQEVINRLPDIDAALSSTLSYGLHTSKICLGGHSAGSGAVITHAGATRAFSTNPAALGYDYTFLPSRLAQCHICCSIQGIDPLDHLAVGSWTSVRDNAQVLMLTGVGDTPGMPPYSADRSYPYTEMPGTANSKYLYYLTVARPNHGFYNLAGNFTLSLDLGDWMVSAAWAFLDANLKSSARGRDWIDRSPHPWDSDGRIDWRRK